MKEFDKYVGKFDISNRITRLKYNHSYRVRKIQLILSEGLGLTEKEKSLSEDIGMLHDIGRFEQIKKYNTLSDINTMDHADFGVYLLFDENLIKDFPVSKEDYEIVYPAIKYHNKYSTPDELKDELQVKLIRDSDKIDILNIWANLDEIDIKSDGKVSKEVSNEFYSHQMIHNEFKKTNSDGVIGTLSYIFDINYDESLNYINEKKYIWNLYDRLDNKDELKEYFDEVQLFINTRLKKKSNKTKSKVKNYK